jgi:hypothetical protein
MKKVITLFLTLAFPAISYAQVINEHNSVPNLSAQGMNSAGLENVAPLVEKLTPEQKAQIIKSVKSLKSQWEKLPKEQQQKMISQLFEAYDTFDFSNADPKQLDMNKMQDLNAVNSDLEDFLQDNKRAGNKLY